MMRSRIQRWSMQPAFIAGGLLILSSTSAQALPVVCTGDTPSTRMGLAASECPCTGSPFTADCPELSDATFTPFFTSDPRRFVAAGATAPGRPGSRRAGAAATKPSTHYALTPTPIPEPASLLLVGAGLLIAGLRIKRLAPRA